LAIERVILLDIDGTLLSTPITEEGEGRRYVEAIRNVVGRESQVVPSRFGGMVDPQICKILLSEVGLNDSEVEYFLPKVLARMGEIYGKMEKTLGLNSGVTGLLAILATNPKGVTGVLTGNLRAIAEEKLIRTGIRPYCTEVFCADQYLDRISLVESAVGTCVGKYFLKSTREVLIVGDTPLDVEAANASHATSVGIATGVYNMERLSQAGATLVYPNLEPTKGLLKGLGLA